MGIASSSAVETIARVLAGQRASINADGADPSAGDRIDVQRKDHLEDAIAALKTLRKPDAAMASAGRAHHFRLEKQGSGRRCPSDHMRAR